MALIKINDESIKQFESDLKTFARRAYPFATKNTVNKSAFIAQKLYRRNADNNMIQRNKFTKQSIQVEPSRTLNVSRQSATVGSIAPYMEDQEFGRNIMKKGVEGVPIATSYAAGQSENAQPRTRLPRKPNTMKSIQLAKRRRRGKSKRQQNLTTIKAAAKSGRRYIFLETRRTKGIFRVLGGQRRPRIKMIWNMDNQSVSVPANPMLKPAVDRTSRIIPRIYHDSLVFQLKRNDLFRG